MVFPLRLMRGAAAPRWPGRAGPTFEVISLAIGRLISGFSTVSRRARRWAGLAFKLFALRCCLFARLDPSEN